MSKIAIDTQLMLRNHARRMLLGAAEAAKHEVLLPETAATMASLKYHRVARKYVERSLKWENPTQWRATGEEERIRLIEERLTAACNGFARWLEEEPRRNDAAFRIAPRTRTCMQLAIELARAGVVDDDDDRRWEVGEDPYVLAEALEAGAHWVASGNFETLDDDEMERWLDRAQAQGRYLNVPRPFILKPDQAVRMLLTQRERSGTAGDQIEQLTTALALALSEPQSLMEIARRVVVTTRFGYAVGNAGMRQAGRHIQEWAEEAANSVSEGRGEAVWKQIERMRMKLASSDVQITREAEDRRIKLEAGLPGGTPRPRITHRPETSGYGGRTR